MKKFKNKKERFEKRNRRDFIFLTYEEVPILTCFHPLGSASCYHLCATLPQENPLV
jgi:hypothetical protein